MNDFGPKRPMSEDTLCESTGVIKAKRGRPKKKPGYDRAEAIDELFAKVVESFGIPFDDREERPEDAPTIVSVANALQITPIKVRKMLITAGYYMDNDLAGIVNARKIHRLLSLTITAAQNAEIPIKSTKPRCRIAPQWGSLYAKTAEKPDSKRFSGIEKVHRNSIRITVDLWWR